MSITSMLFLFVFLPLSLLGYYVVSDRIKEYVLLCVSLVFYALGSTRYIGLFTVAVIITVIIGRSISQCNKKSIKRCLLIAGVVFNAGILVYYKYFDFAVSTFGKVLSRDVELKNLALPLGISFFTFKAISYLIDVYMGKVQLNNNPFKDALYLSFFAQIQAGPLSRYDEMNKPIARVFNSSSFSNGVYRFLIGFIKKVLIANVLANVTNEVFDTPFDNFSTSFAWLGAICFSLQLFFDFSGYSDMAIGLTKMFGYECKENFNYPYMTESVTKFWRRWHISLSEWFRDYIYIPLGGSRNRNKWKVYFNLFVVWILTGIWHGASWNFVAWGLGYFLVISLEKCTNLPGRIKTEIGRITYRVLSIVFIIFQWVIFNSKDYISGLRFIKKMIIPVSCSVTDKRTLFLIKDYWFFIVIAILFSFPIVPKMDEKIEQKKALSTVYEVVKMLIIIVGFLLAMSFAVAGQNNPFAYANF